MQIRVDRFSPYFNDPEQFGITGLKPFEAYGLIHDLPEEALFELAYFFDFDKSRGSSPDYLKPFLKAVQDWCFWSKKCTLEATVTPEEMTIKDTRPCARNPLIFLTPIQGEIFLYTDAVRRREEIISHMMTKFHGANLTPEGITQFLQVLVDARLMIQEADLFLGLPIIRE
jgi:hypothetical protein